MMWVAQPAPGLPLALGAFLLACLAGFILCFARLLAGSGLARCGARARCGAFSSSSARCLRAGRRSWHPGDVLGRFGGAMERRLSLAGRLLHRSRHTLCGLSSPGGELVQAIPNSLLLLRIHRGIEQPLCLGPDVFAGALEVIARLSQKLPELLIPAFVAHGHLRCGQESSTVPVRRAKVFATARGCCSHLVRRLSRARDREPSPRRRTESARRAPSPRRPRGRDGTDDRTVAAAARHAARSASG